MVVPNRCSSFDEVSVASLEIANVCKYLHHDIIAIGGFSATYAKIRRI
jgi:hypothetical protein